MPKPDKALELIKKHQSLGKEDVAKQFRQYEERKQKYVMDAASCEKELEAFNQILDPLINPVTNNPFCWIRRPTQKELESLIPDEFMKYRNDPNGVPEDAMEGNEDVLFTMMEYLIDTPKHTADEWKDRANLVFQRLFQMHIQQVLNDLGITVGNF